MSIFSHILCHNQIYTQLLSAVNDKFLPHTQLDAHELHVNVQVPFSLYCDGLLKQKHFNFGVLVQSLLSVNWKHLFGLTVFNKY